MINELGIINEYIKKVKDINLKSEKTLKACVITYGCQQNENDSEKIAGMLEAMNV